MNKSLSFVGITFLFFPKFSSSFLALLHRGGSASNSGLLPVPWLDLLSLALVGSLEGSSTSFGGGEGAVTV